LRGGGRKWYIRKRRGEKEVTNSLLHALGGGGRTIFASVEKKGSGDGRRKTRKPLQKNGKRLYLMGGFLRTWRKRTNATRKGEN